MTESLTRLSKVECWLVEHGFTLAEYVDHGKTLPLKHFGQDC